MKLRAKNTPLTKLLAVALLCLLLPVACSKKKDDASSTSNSVHEIPTSSLDEAKILAKQSSVKCKNLADCNESVAMLTVAKPNGLALCTAFLVDKQTLATNSHCIPKEIKDGSAPCSDRINAVFPGTQSQEEEKISCEQFLKASPLPSTSDQDIAFLKIVPTKRKAIHTSKSGLADNQLLTIYKITPQKNNPPEGLLQKDNCKAVQNSYVLPGFNKNLSSTVTVADCAIQGGNSGSPLLNDAGEVAAIAQALVHIDDNPVAQNILKTYANTDHFAPMLFASSFACITLPGQSNLDMPKECVDQITANPKYIETKISPDMNSDLQNEILQLLPTHNSEFQWQVKRINPSNFYASYNLVPKCVQHELNTINMELPKAELNYSLPEIKLTVQFNEYLQSTVLQSGSVKNVRVSLQKTNSKTNVFLVDLFYAEDSDDPIYEAEINYCE